jgi:hypothetical protein
LGQNFVKVAGETLNSATRKRGAEGANPELIRTKLSGKRTVTSFNPGKIPVAERDTEGDKSQAWGGIISQVKRQEEGDIILVVLPLFILGEVFERLQKSLMTQKRKRG